MRKFTQESLQGPKSPSRVRRLAAAGLLAASALVGAGCSGNEAGPQESPEATALTPGPEKLVVRLKHSFETHGQTVDVLTIEDAEIEGTALSKEKIEKRAKLAASLPTTLPKATVQIGAGDGTAPRPVEVSIGLGEGQHGFIVTENQDQLNVAIGGDVTVPAATSIDLETGMRASAFVLVDKDEQTRFGVGNANEFNLAVEACNNMVDVEISDQAFLDEAMSTIDSADAQGILNVMQKLVTESVCNSYALATSAFDAGMTHAEYQEVAAGQTLGQEAGIGLEIGYVTFPQEVFAQLGSVVETS